MKTTQLAIVLALLFISTQAIAQTNVEDLVIEGIQYHDEGNYDKAIEIYKKALKIDPKSTTVNYEIAFSYFTKGDYKNAIKHSDIVLDQNTDHMLPAYITKGSSLDLIGKTQESIELFEKAIKETEPHYLLFYNLAVNYHRLENLEKAEENLIEAIYNNPNHSSSHLMLASIQNQKGNSVQTLLASHFFLFLEPDSKRSVEAYEMLQDNFGGNVSKDENQANTININISPNSDNQLGAAQIMISMIAASKYLEENKNKTEDELFIENTEKLFNLLGELNKDTNDDIWSTFYIPFYYDLAKSDHLETYCRYITQIGNENSLQWLNENQEKITEFSTWLNSE